MSTFLFLAVRIGCMLAVALQGIAPPATFLPLAWLSLSIAALLVPVVPAAPVPASPVAWAVALGGEALTGCVAGAAVRLCLDMARAAGAVADTPAGFGTAPALAGPWGGELVGSGLASLWAAAAGWAMVRFGLPLVLPALARSAVAMPPGDAWSGAWVAGIAHLMSAAMALAGPVLAVTGVAHAALGMLGRSGPALTLWSAGFSVLTGMALLAAAAAWPFAVSVVSSLAAMAAGLAERLLVGR